MPFDIVALVDNCLVVLLLVQGLCAPESCAPENIKTINNAQLFFSLAQEVRYIPLFLYSSYIRRSSLQLSSKVTLLLTQRDN